jgi:hypothetical protein
VRKLRKAEKTAVEGTFSTYSQNSQKKKKEAKKKKITTTTNFKKGTFLLW